MSRIKRGRPSPAILVAVMALVAALAGTALAGSGPSATSAASLKKVEKTANKAKKKAKKANKAAKAAQGSADAAQGSADAAQGSADAAQGAADAAQGTANTANGKANANATELGTTARNVEISDLGASSDVTGTGDHQAFANCPAGKVAIGSTARITGDGGAKEYAITGNAISGASQSIAESKDLAAGDNDSYTLTTRVICADQ